MQIRPLNAKDLDTFSHHGKTIKGCAIESEGEVLGVFGVLHTSPLQAFSEIDDKITKTPRVVVKAIRKFRQLVESYHQPIYAIASEKYESSTGLLVKAGFKEIDKRVYLWKE